jgi:peptidoglycan/xylan/chitin deacetylase (PgdA/CDA1 family)
VGRIDRLIARSPINAAFRGRAASRLTVLAYHGIDDVGAFTRQLDHLRQRHRALTVDELIAFVAAREPLPSRSVLITFDDGHRSLLELGLPLLRERGLPAAAFVVTGLVDTDEPFWWDEVDELVASGGTAEHVAGLAAGDVVRHLKRAPDASRLAVIDSLRASASRPARRGVHLSSADLLELEAGGVTVGSHTVTHPILPACPIDKTRDELERSRAQLTEILGRPPRAFAYPNGATDEHVTAAAADAGYEVAFLFDHRLSATPVDDPMLISRVRVNSTTPMERFEAIVSGLHPWLHHRLLRRN